MPWCDILRLLAHCYGLEAMNEHLLNMPNKVILWSLSTYVHFGALAETV